jgi:hypothetical protein
MRKWWSEQADNGLRNGLNGFGSSTGRIEKRNERLTPGYPWILPPQELVGPSCRVKRPPEIPHEPARNPFNPIPNPLSARPLLPGLTTTYSLNKNQLSLDGFQLLR